MSIHTDLDLLIKVNEYLDSPENRGAGGPVVHTFERDIELTDGTTSGKADLAWSDRRTLSGSGNEVLDLAGSLSDSFGNTITFAEVVLVYVRNRESADGNDLQVGPDSTAGWEGLVADASDRITVAAGGFLLWYDPNGQAVSGGSTDELYVEDVGGNGATYDVLIVGRSA